MNYFVPQRSDDPDPAALFAYVPSGRYPLSRPLHLYVNEPPGEPLLEAVEAFVREALSVRGQGAVAENGYAPLPVSMRQDELWKLEPDYRASGWARLRERLR